MQRFIYIILIVQTFFTLGLHSELEAKKKVKFEKKLKCPPDSKAMPLKAGDKISEHLQLESTEQGLACKLADNTFHGPLIVWDANNQVRVEAGYSHNKKHHGWMVWNGIGQAVRLVSYKKGLVHGPVKSWFENGQLRFHLNSFEGKKHGKQQWFFPNGRLNRLEHYKFGSLEGKVIQWYTGGNKMIQQNYVNNKLHGEVIQYHQYGSVKERHYYDHGVRVK